MPKPSVKQQRTRRANGRLVADGRSARGRRARELLDAYSTGADPANEQMTGLIRSAVSLQIEIEGLEDKIDRSQAVDHFAFARLVNSRERVLRKLSELKAEARAGAPRQKVQGGWTSALWRHLHFMSWVDEQRGESSFAETINDPAFKREYERLEAQGLFRDVAR
jgi:hypothetical protein